MKITDVIANMIIDMFDDDKTTVQIGRNDLAQKIGCVPSQINYVITSRFTPERGYSVESRRGGGGYILIKRANVEKGVVLISLINSIGNSIDERTLKAHIYNLEYQKIIDDTAARIMKCIATDKCYGDIGDEKKNQIRCALFKQMLVAGISE